MESHPCSPAKRRRAQPGARANGAEPPWLILNVRRRMPSLQKIATFVIFGGFASAWVFHSIGSRLADSSDSNVLGSMALHLDEKKMNPSPALRWIVRRNIATAATVFAAIAFGIALNFVS